MRHLMEMDRSRCQLVAYLPPNQRSRALHRNSVDPGLCLLLVYVCMFLLCVGMLTVDQGRDVMAQNVLMSGREELG